MSYFYAPSEIKVGETLPSWMSMIFCFRSINTFLFGAKFINIFLFGAKLSNFVGNILFCWKDGLAGAELASRLACCDANKRTEMPKNRSPCICCKENGKHIFRCGSISSTFPCESVGRSVTLSDAHSIGTVSRHSLYFKTIGCFLKGFHLTKKDQPTYYLPTYPPTFRAFANLFITGKSHRNHHC